MKNQFINRSTIVLLLSLFYILGKAQMIIRDDANYDQEKRMVFINWSDWSPDPTLTWFGFPKNLYGWVFWDVINHSYYRGPDIRPFKAGGQFDQNYAWLQAQKSTDYQLRDTTNAMANISLTTDLNMTGGDLDVPYFAYFKDKFNSLNTDITNAMTLLNQTSPQLYTEMSNSTWGKNYMERLTIINERINTTHSVYVDRGKRMVNYFNILNEFQTLHENMVNYLYSWYSTTKLPPANVLKPGNRKTTIFKSDEQLEREISQKWQPE